MVDDAHANDEPELERLELDPETGPESSTVTSQSVRGLRGAADRDRGAASGTTAAVAPGGLGDLIDSARSLFGVLGSVTAAMQPPRLVVGLMLAATLMALGHLWDALASESIPVGALRIGHTMLDTLDVESGSIALPTAAATPFAATLEASVAGIQGIAVGVIRIEPLIVARSLGDLLLGIPLGLWSHDRLFLVGYGFLFLAVTGLFGGALARMAACDLAGSERLGAEASIDFAASCWRSLLLAPIAPLIIAMLLWSIVAVIGVAMRWPWVEVLGAILSGPALVLGALVAISLLGYALAFPMLIPAVACERCDAGESQQRAFAYLLQRPVRLAASMGLGIVGFGIGYVVVAGIAAVTLQVTAWGLAATAGDAAAMIPDGYGPFTLSPPADARPDGASASIAVGIAGVWRTLVVGLVAGWVFAYYYAASTTIYLGLREATDGQEPSEIWRPGMVHGTFVLTGDDSERVAAARDLDARWRRTLAWLARRRA